MMMTMMMISNAMPGKASLLSVSSAMHSIGSFVHSPWSSLINVIIAIHDNCDFYSWSSSAWSPWWLPSIPIDRTILCRRLPVGNMFLKKSLVRDLETSGWLSTMHVLTLACCYVTEPELQVIAEESWQHIALLVSRCYVTVSQLCHSFSVIS